MPSIRSFLCLSTKSTSTLTLSASRFSTLPKTCLVHISFQLSGEWQNILFITFSAESSPDLRAGSSRNPFSGNPPCWPKITDPVSGDNSEAMRRATSSCFSSLKRWKKAPANIADTLPRRGFKERRPPKNRAGVEDLALLRATMSAGSAGASKAGSKMSPAMKAAGNVCGVDLKSSWPQSQKPDKR